MKTQIKTLLNDVLPAVDFDEDFLFSQLDSLSIATILFVLSAKYDILLDAEDVTPRNFRSLDSIVAMVQSKMTLEKKIYQHSLSTPDKTAVVCGDSSITYSELWKAICARMA